VKNSIPVGTAPVWADFAPTLNELLVTNAGNGTTPGSVTVVSIPLCTQSTVVTNPNCDIANPVDASGFGAVVATIPVGINPFMIAVLQDGSQAYVANAGDPTKPCAAPTAAAPVPNCSVSVINLGTMTVVATIPAVASVNQSDSYLHGRPNFIAATTGTPTGKIYVTAADSTDISIIRTDTDVLQTHLSLQGTGVSVRTSQP
jgi:DNA-binding beta-propeller fold protein YncE